MFGSSFFKRLLLCLFVFVVSFSFVCCDLSGDGSLEAPGYGSLIINIKEFTKSVQPVEEDLKVESYKIAGKYSGIYYTSDSERSFTDTFPGSQESYTINKILAGSWEITIEGYDKGGVKTVSKSEKVGVKKGTGPTSVTIKPKPSYVSETGNGNFYAKVSVPSGCADSVKIEIRETGEISGLIEYAINTTATSAGFDVFESTKTDIKSGEYKVKVSLYNGSNLLKIITDTDLYIFSDLTSKYEDKVESLEFGITYKDINGKELSGEHENPDKYEYGKELVLMDASKTGYTFCGWFRESDCSGTPVDSIEKGSMWDVTLYAKWEAKTYIVTLNQTDATNKGTTSATAVFGEALSDITVPSRKDHAFAGYYTEVDGKGECYYDSEGKSVKNWDIDSDTTLYAKWIKGEAVTYTTEYYQEQLDGTYKLFETATDLGPVKEKVTAKPKTYEGFTEDEGHADRCAEGEASSDLVLKLYYKRNRYTVTFAVADTQETFGTISVTSRSNIPYGTEITSDSNTLTIKTSSEMKVTATPVESTTYTNEFAYWKGDSVVKGDMTITAYFNHTPKTYSVTYKDMNDADFSGSNNSLPDTHTYDSETVLGTTTKTGYTFDGWYTSKECDGTSVTNLGATDYEADITLYAKWTAKTYVIVLDKNVTETDLFDGEVVATYDSNNLSFTSETERAGFAVEGYYAEPECKKLIITSDGNLVAKVDGYTDSDGKWIKDWSDTTRKLYANWVEDYADLGLLSDKFAVDDYGKLYITDSSSFDDLKLKKVIVPQQIGGKNVKSLGSVFTDSDELEKIKLEGASKLAKLNNAAFSGCENLTYVALPEELTEIGVASFSGCGALTEIEIPETVDSIGAGAFSDTGLENFGFTRASDDEFSMGALCFAGCKDLKTVELPKGLDYVEDYLFFNCSSLEEVSIPNSVVSMGRRVFAQCRNESSTEPIMVKFDGNAWLWNLMDKPDNWNGMESGDDSFSYSLLKSGEDWSYDVVNGKDNKFYDCFMLLDGGDTSDFDNKCCIAVSCTAEGYDAETYEPLISITSTPEAGSHEYIDTGVHYNVDGMEYELKYRQSEELPNTYSTADAFFKDFSKEKYVDSKLNKSTNVRCLSGIFVNSGVYNGGGNVYNGIYIRYGGDKQQYPSTFRPNTSGYDYPVGPTFRDNTGATITYKWNDLMVVTARNTKNDMILDVYSPETGARMNATFDAVIHSGKYNYYDLNNQDYLDKLFALLKNETDLNTIPLFCGKYIKKVKADDPKPTVEYANFVAMTVYYYKIYYVDVNGNKSLKSFLVPCKNKSTGEIGMYDLQSSTFHGMCRLDGETDDTGFEYEAEIGQWFKKH